MKVQNFMYFQDWKIERKKQRLFQSKSTREIKVLKIKLTSCLYLKSSGEQLTAAAVQFFPLLSNCATTSLRVKHKTLQIDLILDFQ